MSLASDPDAKTTTRRKTPRRQVAAVLCSASVREEFIDFFTQSKRKTRPLYPCSQSAVATQQSTKKEQRWEHKLALDRLAFVSAARMQ